MKRYRFTKAILIFLMLLGSVVIWNRPSDASVIPVPSANGQVVVSAFENGEWVEQGSLSSVRFRTDAVIKPV
ncbi:hypothetical protein [Paenibacillus sp. NEAU-GSW1]|uniref:hypothetical protein n=1 Tax=Paenibacillus sp. NEAU-GSW1 TaxID=2682486 RepID=UPI0012E3151E|nr:hypothetical protein [Paenibacillus sp. NEAU-GSW1]MUT65804.1 hypothetical protein [Paenibacillus sp. NEAU-GSW1]